MWAYLTNTTGPVPHKVIPVTVIVMALVHDLADQVIHGHAEDSKGPQLIGQGLLLVS